MSEVTKNSGACLLLFCCDVVTFSLQCFDTVGCAAGRAPGLYGPADVTATHCLAPVKSRLVLPFWYRLTQVVPRKRAIKQVCVFVCSLLVQGFGSPAEYVVPWAHLSPQL